MPEQLQVRVVTTSEDAEAERRAAADLPDYEVAETEPVRLSPQGRPVDPSLAESLPPEGLSEARFVEPVTMVITLTLGTLAIRLVNHWMRSREAGVQIDTRTVPATVSRLAGVPFGTMTFIHPDSSTTVRREPYEAPEDVMDDLARYLPAS